MQGKFYLPDFIVPYPQPAIKMCYPIKGVSRMYVLPSGYAVNKFGVCLNPVPVYSFHGNAVVIALGVAQFMDGKLSFDTHFELVGQSYNGYAAAYNRRQSYFDIKHAIKAHLDAAVQFCSHGVKWIESESKMAMIGAETEKIQDDIKELFVLPKQILLF